MVKFRLQVAGSADPALKLKRAAAYVRMSTEHQQYSPVNQRAGIEQFAATHGFMVVRIYADEGQSGLGIAHRGGLQTLLADVGRPDRDFEAVLVLDVSRWGRFQDVDQSAYYEYLCRLAGVQVHYCGEPFANDGTPVSTLLKSMKRVMAAEYSEELSRKVVFAKDRLARLGFWVTGSAIFGYRRQLVSAAGDRCQVLEQGERKYVHGGHVTLVSGPAEEVATVRAIFKAYVEGMQILQITARLQRGELAGCGAQPWGRSRVRRVLGDERYIGTQVYNKSSQRLGGRRTANAEEQVIRVEGAFEGIIDRELFLAAKQRLGRIHYAATDEELLERLGRYAQQHPKITKKVIDAAADLASSATYIHRFGGLKAALALIRQRQAETDAEGNATTVPSGEPAPAPKRRAPRGRRA